MSTTNPPKALLFDVFGTVVDWRSTVTNHLSTSATTTLNSPSASLPASLRFHITTISWPLFAQSWRDSYLLFTRTHQDPSSPFISVDQHHHSSLISLLAENGLSQLWTDEEVLDMSRIWHFLHAWPDSANGLQELNQAGFITSTLSNGNVSLLQDLAAHAQLPFKHILSAELFGAYKPSPTVYNGAAAHLGLQARECAMVAAHLGDLKAAKECGFQTIYIEREGEESWSLEDSRAAKREGWVDMWVGLEERFVGGGIAEIERKFKRGRLG